MKKASLVLLIVSLMLIGCGTDKSISDEQKQTDNSIGDTSNDNEETVNDESNDVANEDEKADSKETSNNSSKTSTDSSKKTETSSKNTNETTSSKSETSSKSGASSKSSTSSGSSSNDNKVSSDTSTTKPSVPKEEPKKPTEPEKKWAMSETEMIEYAKKCIINYKPTSGYGKCEWAQEFNKKNSGWFAPITIKITMDMGVIKERITGAINATLRKTTSQILDDGKGNIDKEVIYGAKGYLEKIDNGQYKFYVFY